jgi:hypothetical protein
MAVLPRYFALLSFVPNVASYFQCSNGFEQKPDNDNAKCPGANSQSCNDVSCCNVVKTCAHWVANSKTCDSGDYVADPTKSAPADNGGNTLTSDKFKSTCCTKKPSTCADHSVVWIGFQAFNGGCRKDGAKKFFDLQKLTTEVASPQDEPAIEAACCTLSSEARCEHWTFQSCALGDAVADPAKAAPADNDGNDISSGSYRSACCSTPPKTCAHYSASWVLNQAANLGCRKDDAKKFFDLKKLTTEVASPQDDPTIAAACCTLSSEATCADWLLDASGNLMPSCSTGKVKDSTASAPADTDGVGLSADKYKELCCAEPMACKDWTEEVSAGSSIFQRTAAISTAVGMLVALRWMS